MSYLAFDNPQPALMFSPADPIRQASTTFSTDQSQVLNAMDGAPYVSNFGGYEESNGYPGYGVGNQDEGIDAARGPRLTQDQLAQLELEFARNFKPNTDYKRGLAERMGVDYSKVTVGRPVLVLLPLLTWYQNWFQNRRAKAKHEGHAQQRSDRSLQDIHSSYGSAPVDYRRISDSHDPANFSSPEQAPIVSDDLGSAVGFSCLSDVSQPFYSHHSSIPISQGFDTSTTFSPDNANTGNLESYAGWPGTSVCIDDKLPTSSVQEISPLGLMSASPSVHSSYLDLSHGNPQWHPPPMYNTMVGGQLGGNPSSQSFATSASEEGEQISFITPPQETSPLPGAHQDRVQHDRQASNSSELAENLNIVHLQQSNTSIGLQGSGNSTSGQYQNNPTGLPTPEVSPDTAAPKLPFASGHDLASRRKRPRPAALQPEPNRAVSFAGQSTNSPGLRVSPPVSGKISPVRRVKSTGNPLTVMTGRVKKSGTTVAQMSPRNLESCFKVASIPEDQPKAEKHSPNRQTSGTSGNSIAAPSPNHSDQHPQAAWPELATQVPLPSSSWQHGASEIVHDPTLPSEAGWPVQQTEYTNVNFGFSIPQSSHAPSLTYHLPPQSAPSHVTTFDAASVMPGHIAPEWQTSHIQPEPYRDDTRLSVTYRLSHPQHHSRSGPFEYYQSLASSQQAYGPPLGTFFPFAPFSSRTPSPPQKTLDIKVETGPPPPKEMTQTSQERKEYTFENAFADDPHFATGSRK